MRRRRARKATILIPVVSMGDIAFLLIIFFILCSNFAKKAGKTVEPPHARKLTALPKPRLYVAVDADSQMYLQGRPIGSAAEIEADLTRIVDPNASPDARTVVFECDRSVRKNVFEPILEAISNGGGIPGLVGKEGAARKKE